MHDVWRGMFPDPRKQPLPLLVEGDTIRNRPAGDLRVTIPTDLSSTEAVQGSATADDGILSADASLKTYAEPIEEEVTPSTKNHWQENADYWIFWKVRPSRATIQPILRTKPGEIQPGPLGGPTLEELDGTRSTEATMFTDEGDVTVLINDRFDVPRSYGKDSKLDWDLIHKVPWTGSTFFRKRQPGLSAESG